MALSDYSGSYNFTIDGNQFYSVGTNNGKIVYARRGGGDGSMPFRTWSNASLNSSQWYQNTKGYEIEVKAQATWSQTTSTIRRMALNVSPDGGTTYVQVDQLTFSSAFGSGLYMTVQGTVPAGHYYYLNCPIGAAWAILE